MPRSKYCAGRQYQDALDPLSIKMPEVSGVAGQQIPGLAGIAATKIGRSFQSRRMFSATVTPRGASTVEMDCSQLDVVELPEPGQSGGFYVYAAEYRTLASTKTLSKTKPV